MTPELQSETMAKFNLSRDQWDLMPLMVREALAGCEVKQAEQVKFEWYPAASIPRNSQTVFLTMHPGGSGNSAHSHNAIGFWNGDEWEVTVGELAPGSVTHWCPMPGGTVRPEEADD